ncbi:MAG TPA: hypothetical protein VKB69_13120 [Micromonosporaceae bacterium]|nr:hypothetical protein [Micromonosporaceae bacterium]
MSTKIITAGMVMATVSGLIIFFGFPADGRSMQWRLLISAAVGLLSGAFGRSCWHWPSRRRHPRARWLG